MIHLLVLAQDECVRLTCAEVLARLGFEATAGEWPVRAAERRPDAILVWEATEADVAAIRAAFGEAPLVVCTWRHRDPWPRSVGVVRLPFNAERVARIVERTVHQVRKLASRSPR